MNNIEMEKMNEKCQVCGEEKERIEEHHINPPSDNTIKLCPQCHKTVHWKRNPKGWGYFEEVENKDLLLELWKQIDNDGHIKTKCKFCGYEWMYSGCKVEGQYVCCPNCMKRVKIGEVKK